MGKYNSNEPKVSIPLSTFQQLSDDAGFLAALIGAGVDNWSGYDDAVEAHEAELQRAAGAD
mgnify:CR=1 FL=1